MFDTIFLGIGYFLFIVLCIVIGVFVFNIELDFYLSPKEKEKRLMLKIEKMKARNFFNSSTYIWTGHEFVVTSYDNDKKYVFMNKHGYSLHDYGWYFRLDTKICSFSDAFLLEFQKILLNAENKRINQCIKNNHKVKMLALKADLNQARLDSLNIKKNEFSEVFKKSQWYLSKAKSIDDLRKEILRGPP